MNFNNQHATKFEKLQSDIIYFRSIQLQFEFVELSELNFNFLSQLRTRAEMNCDMLQKFRLLIT